MYIKFKFNGFFGMTHVLINLLEKSEHLLVSTIARAVRQ